MNIFGAVFSVFADVFLTGRQAAAERQQQGPAGVAYDEELKRQYDAYYKAHGTADGFEYKDPA